MKEDKELALAVKELRSEIRELRTAVNALLTIIMELDDDDDEMFVLRESQKDLFSYYN